MNFNFVVWGVIIALVVIAVTFLVRSRLDSKKRHISRVMTLRDSLAEDPPMKPAQTTSVRSTLADHPDRSTRITTDKS